MVKFPVPHQSSAQLRPVIRTPPDPRLRPLPQLIFMSRWLQLPLYLGLIVAQGVYVWQFWVELVHLVQASTGDSGAAQAVIASVT
ncbi:MAG TPA: YqhA family protein, partial [Casimicrobiaceae bacterium]|nr:YqhA family protein [Casimicrobiaceae bacterium]